MSNERSALALVLAIAACDRPRDEAPVDTPVATPTVAAPEPAPPPELPADRRCGEAGREPTALPPLLKEGMVQVGTATVRPGETKTIGTVSLAYDEHAWIGSRGSGHRGAALKVLIEQAEAKGAAWGHDVAIDPKREETFVLGPYHIATKVGDGDEPEVTAVVRKNACPDHADIAATDESRSFWLSTEAIAVQAFDTTGEMVIAAMVARPAELMLELSTLGYQYAIPARTAAKRRIRVAARVVVIDEIIAAGDKVHARLHIEPAPKSIATAPVPAIGCGDPSPQRTTLPAVLAAGAPVVDDLHLSPGETAKAGKLALALVQPPEDMPIDLRLDISSDDPDTSSSMMFSASGFDSRVEVVGASLLRGDADSDGEVRVRRMQLACDPTLTIATPSAPTLVWMSSAGRNQITVGEQSPLRLRIYPGVTDAQLSAESESMYLSRAIVPTTQGEGFTLGAWELEVVDVVASGDLRWAEQRWHGTAAVPAIHVQLRITPPT
ncbi:MAG TPA: hypothetical protein VG755_32710 [Nannocystaceae bacterium]|nr:hypothetical protein [Nannocystaceae bacterium]